MEKWPLFLFVGICIKCMAIDSFQHDICVYGDSPAAVTAALQATEDGHSVSLVVPGSHIGGMLVEGLGSQDINNHKFQNSVAVGGMAEIFYERVGAYYGQESVYRFESKVAEAVILEWLDESGVDVFLNNRLAERYDAVRKNGTDIVSLEMENGRRFAADVFIDGTIEGDLMKWAGVSFATGREGNQVYGETLNGIRSENPYREFAVSVDPYVVPGDPSSGVIATIQDEPLDTPGDGDHRIMGFCFRSCLTRDEKNKIPFLKPADYDDANYEIYRRYLSEGGRLFSPTAKLPNGKTDLGSWHDLSGNLYGMNHEYADGDYATRERIYQEHLSFVQGLYWFLANDPSVPSDQRNEWAKWGLAADEFLDNFGWPRKLYVRSARRMISDYVITEADVTGAVVADDSVGVAYWPPDMHHARRIIRNGKAYNEGFVFGAEVDWKPFPISYRAIVPKRSECTNLIVPAALSSSYVAYGSIRLEWTFMVLGQSAGAAAAQALVNELNVQDIDYTELCEILESTGQIMSLEEANLGL